MLTLDTIKRRRVWLALTGLIALTAAVYWRVGGHEFLRYDDPDYVTLNTHVNQGLTAEGLAWAFGNLHGDATYWHPLTWVSHMIDCELFGLKPGPHHLVNLAFHIANVVLLFLVVLRMTADFWPTLLLAALWAVHPLQVDTVAWVTERKNLLSGMFWLLTMGAYVRYAEKPGLGRYWPVPLLMALGLMTKPILVTLPCALLLLDFWPLRRMRLKLLEPSDSLSPSEGERAGERGLSGALPQSELPANPRFPAQTFPRLLLEKVPLLALSAASSAITILAHQKLGSILSGEIAPLSLRLQAAFVSYARYLGKAIFPADLSVFYPNPVAWPASQVVFSAVLLVTLCAIVIFWIRRIPAAAVGWFWFLGVMTPTIGILQAGSQSIADRFMYLPLLGLLVAAIWGIRYALRRFQVPGLAEATHPGAATGTRQAHSLSSSEEERAGERRDAGGWELPKWRTLAIATCTVLLVTALAAGSMAQVRHWKNTFTLFHHAMKVTENNYIAYAVIGTLLQEDGKTKEALPYLQQALQYQPSHHECRLVFANALTVLKQYDEAFEHYSKAVEKNPRFADGYNSWAASLAAAGRFSDALPKVDEALRLHPTHINGRLLHARLLQQLGRIDEAAAASREALRLFPTNTMSLLVLGNEFLRHRRFLDALALFQHVLKINPDSVEALSRVAWLLATCPEAHVRNGPEAIRLAARACELTGNRDALSLNALAAAYAETGQFPRATATAARSLELAKESGQHQTASIVEALLRKYEAGSPYRDE